VSRPEVARHHAREDARLLCTAGASSASGRTTASRPSRASASRARDAPWQAKGKAGSRARKRNSDDYNGLGLLLVTALRQPIPLPVHEPATHERSSRCGDELPLEDFNRESRAPGLPGTVSAAAARSCLVRRAVGHLGLRLRHSVQREQQLGALPVLPRRRRLAAEVRWRTTHRARRRTGRNRDAPSIRGLAQAPSGARTTAGVMRPRPLRPPPPG
jgi:hypothetical protein